MAELFSFDWYIKWRSVKYTKTRLQWPSIISHYFNLFVFLRYSEGGGYSSLSLPPPPSLSSPFLSFLVFPISISLSSLSAPSLPSSIPPSLLEFSHISNFSTISPSLLKYPKTSSLLSSFAFLSPWPMDFTFLSQSTWCFELTKARWVFSCPSTLPQADSPRECMHLALLVFLKRIRQLCFYMCPPHFSLAL